MQAKNTALSLELVRCTIALMNRSEWEEAGNAVTPQLMQLYFWERAKAACWLPSLILWLRRLGTAASIGIDRLGQKHEVE